MMQYITRGVQPLSTASAFFSSLPNDMMLLAKTATVTIRCGFAPQNP